MVVFEVEGIDKDRVIYSSLEPVQVFLQNMMPTLTLNNNKGCMVHFLDKISLKDLHGQCCCQKST